MKTSLGMRTTQINIIDKNLNEKKSLETKINQIFVQGLKVKFWKKFIRKEKKKNKDKVINIINYIIRNVKKNVEIRRKNKYIFIIILF